MSLSPGLNLCKNVPGFFYLMSQVVVYTDQLPTFGDPILERLDPQRYISFRLYRDATRYTGGAHCRDLSKVPAARSVLAS